MIRALSAALILLAALGAVGAILFLPAGHALWTQAALFIFQRQQELHQSLASDLRSIHDAGPIAAIGLTGLSFIYGVLHALGPGHGKAVVSAYVMADARRLRQGVALAWLASGLQAVVAITLVTVILLVSAAALRQTQITTLLLERLGYAFVVVIGVVIGFSALWRAIGKSDHHCHHHHADGFAHLSTPNQGVGPGGSRLRQGLMVLAVGIRPCSGAVLVLSFAKAVGVFLYGILATIAMSIGTALTVSTLAILTFFFRRMALNVAGERARAIGAIELGLALLAGAGLVLLGSLLLVGSFATPAAPFRI
jgi:ABC-type nickel/cobalt efflux system permease component RcnA